MGGLLGGLFAGRPHYTVQDGPRMAEGRPGMEYPGQQPNLNPNDPYLQPQTLTSPGNANGRPERRVGYQGFLESLLGPSAHSNVFLASTVQPAPQVSPPPPTTQGWTYVAGKGPQWTEQDPFGNPQAPKKPFTGNRV